LPLQGGDGRKIGAPGGENQHAFEPW
jgi:hypothetical protein